MDSIGFVEALAQVLSVAPPLGPEETDFHRAVGRVLAADQHADGDDPPAPKSAMDGYAVAARETLGAGRERPCSFSYEEVLGAGHLAGRRLRPGGAVRIMTGALLPEGADAVVKLEDTESSVPGRFTICRPFHVGEHVIPRGARMARGELVLAAGEVIGPQALAVLASLGRARVPVYRRPRVALLALGDELVEVGRPPAPGQITVSNLYLLEALAARYGAEPVCLGTVGDDPERIHAVLAPRVGAPRSLEARSPPLDVVVTIGGSQRGDFDHVNTVLQSLGARVRFNRVRMSPGSSSVFATAGGCLIFGLPGTPAASLVAFEALVRPALWRLAGRSRLEHRTLSARLSGTLDVRSGRTHFFLARLREGPDGLLAEPIVARHAHEVPASTLAEGLIRCVEGAPPVDARGRVLVDCFWDA